MNELPPEPESLGTEDAGPAEPAAGDVAGAGAAPSLLEELTAALRSGRLVEVLTGNGLARSSVDALLRPESAAELRALLTLHLLTSRLTRGSNSGVRPRRVPCDRGKVLVFKAKERSCP